MSKKYRLMIYFVHSTLVMYSDSIVSHSKMTVGEFMESNADTTQRVFEEGLSVMQYELSFNQICKGCLVYLQAKYFPQSVKNTKCYQFDESSM